MSFITDNLIYIPISAIMWFWHKVFASVGGVIPGVDDPESNGLIWVLSVVFLVVTLRVLLPERPGLFRTSYLPSSTVGAVLE